MKKSTVLPSKGFNPLVYYPQSQSFEGVESETQPDMALPMRELMSRFSRGLPISDAQTRLFDNADIDDELFPDVSHMDYADREKWISRAQGELRELKLKAKHEKEEKQRLFIIEKYEKSKKQQQSPAAETAASPPDSEQ